MRFGRPAPLSGLVYLIGHGETEWSKTGRHAGRTHLPLTAKGRADAAKLAGYFARVTFARVFVGPLEQARETAVLGGPGRTELCDDLREWDYGDYEGLTSGQIRGISPQWTLWTHPCPQGEGIARVRVRADAIVARAFVASGPIALFSHADILRVVAARWLGLPASAGSLFHLDPATVSILGHERGTCIVRSWNESADRA